MTIDLLRRPPDPDPAMTAEVDLEASRWAEISALVELLTRDERRAPGYFLDPSWSIKDLVAHLGFWHAEARSQLLAIATQTYEPHDFDIDRRNAATLAAHKRETWDVVWSQTTAARASMLEAGSPLAGDRPRPTSGSARPAPSTTASTSIACGRGRPSHRPPNASARGRARPMTIKGRVTRRVRWLPRSSPRGPRHPLGRRSGRTPQAGPHPARPWARPSAPRRPPSGPSATKPR